jgi:hypothetical protein
MLFKVLLIAFAVFVLARIANQYRQHKVAAGWFLLWVIFWGGVIAIALSPKTTDTVAQYVGVEKGADLIVYVSLAVIFYALFRLIVRQDAQNRELTELVRRIAIDRAEEPKK